MPYRRRYRRRRVPRPLVGFPSNRVVRMRYIENLTWNFNTLPLFHYGFKANSIYDPNATAGGHQPMGHDQWAQFYNHYVVLRSHLKITFAAAADTNSTPIFYAVNLDDDFTSLTSLTNMLEQGLTSWTLTNGDYEQAPTRSLTKSYYAKDFFNIADVKDNVTRIGAAFGADPPDLAAFQVLAGSVDGGTHARTCFALVQIDYIVLCSEPKTLPLS